MSFNQFLNLDNMKLRYFFVGAAVTLLGLSSCDKDDTVKVEETSGIVKLQATINGHVQTRLDAWAGEAVGFYMIEDNTEFTPVISNKKYTVSSAGAMTPADGVEATYPTDGSNVYFISYHPYSEALVNHVYPIDLTNTEIADHDLVYAKVGPYNQTQEESVSIPHAHQLTLLTVNVQDEEGTAITTATAKINRPVKGKFDLTDGTLTVTANSTEELDMAASDSKVEAMIIPGSAGEIVFVNDNKSFTWDISSIAFAAGNKYTYTIKLIPSAIPTVEVIGTATITDWNSVVVEGTINLDEDTSGDDGSTPSPVYTSNVTLPTGTSAVQTSAFGGKVNVGEGSYDCLKLGTGSNGGSYYVAIGAGKTKANFYAFAWSGDNTTPALVVSISNPESSGNVSLVANTGASNSSPYTMASFESTALHTVTFDETAADATITFSTVDSGKRAIIFGINVE